MDSHTGKILRARCHGATALPDSPHIKGRQTTTRTETNTDVSALDSVGSWLPQALGSVCRLIRGCGGSRLSESQSLPPRCDSRCSAFVFIFHHFLRLFRPKQLHFFGWENQQPWRTDPQRFCCCEWQTLHVVVLTGVYFENAWIRRICEKLTKQMCLKLSYY